VIVAVAPVALLAALLSHPYIAGRMPNDAAIAAAVTAGTTRWALVHIAASVASAVVMLAFIAIAGYLRDAGEERWSTFGLPFIVIGSTLYAVLPGMEFAPLAAVEAGADPLAAQSALREWFVPVLVAGGVMFALGVLALSRAIIISGILSSALTWLVVAALIVMAASRFVPFAAAQFYVQGIASLIAFWPLARRMWKRTSEA
jgi:hypothetical protein